MTIKHLNPDTLHKNPAFSQAITVSAGMRLVFVGGQNGVTKEGKIAGKDIATQSVQAYKNLLVALEAADASIADVVKMTIYLVQGQSFNEAYKAIQPLQVANVKPPTVSGLVVAGLAVPDYLIEIDAVAAVK